jgi:hypothetical protein
MYNENRPPQQKPVAYNLGKLLAILLLLTIFLSACAISKPNTPSAPVDLTKVFPASNALPGWTISQSVETYDHDHLFNLVDGQADSFFVYGFERVAVQRYQNGDGISLNAEIWQLANPADAFGLFTAGQAGTAAAIGNEGDSDPGLRLAFWQDRYFVSLSVDQPVPDETLQAFGKAIVGALPSGGERPAIMSHLPQAGLVERGYIFFHEEMSVQMEVWLGGENLLGLSQETNGVVGRYKLGEVTARLMVIEYPAASQADKGLKALQGGELSDLVASKTYGNLLGAVFGKVDAAQAQTLLQEALK